jgi:hypothetical protein
MYEGPDNRWALSWVTAWDTAADRDEFATRAGELLFSLNAFSRAAPIVNLANNEYVIWLAGDEAALNVIAGPR